MPSVVRSTTQAEEMRQQRNQEARQLIGSSVDKMKAIFNQNSAPGQLTTIPAKTAPVKPIRNSISARSNQRQSPDQHHHHQKQQQNYTTEQQQQEIEQKHIVAPSMPQNNLTQSEINDGLSNNNINNNNQLNEEQNTIDASIQLVNNSEDDDIDSYSTIKRSPYTKVITNNQSKQDAPDKSPQKTEQHANNEIVNNPPAIAQNDNDAGDGKIKLNFFYSMSIILHLNFSFRRHSIS